ncbi:MAG: cysteine--tRNA ligase, partial [Chloroflexi bacterium]|nr:cysteine--tRNA ligase [Chloroflexota bacterium]
MLNLFDSYERKSRPFAPLNPPQVSLYACGLTVYDYAHIGNLRSYIFEDILRRVLEFNGYRVKHVMNITDVGHLTDDADSGEDKME